MAQSTQKGKPKETWLLKIFLLVISLVTLGFFLLLVIMSYDISAALLGTPRSQPSFAGETPAISVLTAGQVSLSASLTPFQPLPTETATLPASPTRTSSPTVEVTPTPTETYTPQPSPTPWPPETASIKNIFGYAQTLNLTCESRSAVDWARYFGVEIAELEFFANLPRSDNPNKGFVGDGDGLPGRTPPESYGVHAYPVAALLRAYGLPAVDRTGMSMDEIKKEVAAGQPVIVWVITGTVPGTSYFYRALDGEEVLVAPYEHTAIVIAYDAGGVTLLDGAVTYWRSWEIFQRSFAALGNMAVIFHPSGQ